MLSMVTSPPYNSTRRFVMVKPSPLALLLITFAVKLHVGTYVRNLLARHASTVIVQYLEGSNCQAQSPCP